MSSRTQRVPRQARSKEKVAAILDASVRLLGSDGYEGISTNSIAKQAGINISTLYSYFPNKEAILERLLERHYDEMIAIVQDQLDRDIRDNRQRVVLMFENTVDTMLREPWFRAFNQALASAPELQQIQAQATQHLLDIILAQVPEALEAPKQQREHRLQMLELVVHSYQSSSLLIVNSPPDKRKALIKEAALMINSYLDNYR